jgi:hypothetical protein
MAQLEQEDSEMIAITPDSDELEVTPLSCSEWLVPDTALPKNEGVGVVADIESRFGIYELLELNKPAERNYFDTLGAAVASIGYSISRAA